MTSITATPAVPASPVAGSADPTGSGGEVARTPTATEKPQTPQPGAVDEAARQVAAQQAAVAEKQSSDSVSRQSLEPNTRLDIEVQKDGGLVVKVRDAKTDKVVREIPPEELVEFGKRLKKYLGLLMDRRA